jgi:hypothetical protein
MTRLLFWIALFVGQLAPALQNTAPGDEIYVSVPESQRQQFKTALENLITLEHSGNWGEIYDKFYLNETASTKDQFVEKRHRQRVVTFVPQKIYYVPPTQSWTVSGCALFSPRPAVFGKGSDGLISDFSAKHTQTGWRFDAPPAITIYKDQPAGARSCSVDQ